MQEADGVFVGAGWEDAIHQVRLYSGEEERLEGVLHVAWAVGGCDIWMRWMSGLEGTRKELGGYEGKVVFYWEGLGFRVEMVNGGHLQAASCDTESRVLDGLEYIDI